MRIPADFIKGEKGSVIIIVALAFTTLLGVTALAVDSGLLYVEHNRLARAADAAALAGAQELPDIAAAGSVAVSYAQQNGVDTSDPNKFQITFTESNKKIKVDIKKNVNLYFARFLGINSSVVSGKAAARIAPVKGITGLVPLGIDEKMLPLVEGQLYEIKIGSPGNGWTGCIEYPGQSGADDYRHSARYGYSGTIRVGDIQAKASGNKSGPTIQGLQGRIDAQPGENWNSYNQTSVRIILVPIYRELGGGPNDQLRIMGFATVFLESISGTGNQNFVNVRYVNRTISAETDDAIVDSYLNSVKLVE